MLQKVIKGLESCTIPGNCGTCPWYPEDDAKEGCIRTLMKATLELLKAQKPRVMTLEEVKEGQAYWLEMRGIASEYAICKLNDHDDSAFLDFAVQYGDRTLESDGYGKRWRCWTSRPTDKLMEAIPWND